MNNQVGSTNECAIFGLIEAISTYLATHRETIGGVNEILAQISSAAIKKKFLKNYSTLTSTHKNILETSINNIRGQSLKAIRECLLSAMGELIWRQDQNEYYSLDSELGEGYRTSNLHTLLIGPSNAKYHHPDFMLGFFLLAPFTFYRDHSHPAPELYVNLSPRTGWRFHGGEWEDFKAGSLIWNETNKVHATRVYDTPFISIFSWVNNINSPCKTFMCKDWKRIESELNVLRGREDKKGSG